MTHKGTIKRREDPAEFKAEVAGEQYTKTLFYEVERMTGWFWEVKKEMVSLKRVCRFYSNVWSSNSSTWSYFC